MFPILKKIGECSRWQKNYISEMFYDLGVQQLFSNHCISVLTSTLSFLGHLKYPSKPEVSKLEKNHLGNALKRKTIRPKSRSSSPVGLRWAPGICILTPWGLYRCTLSLQKPHKGTPVHRFLCPGLSKPATMWKKLSKLWLQVWTEIFYLAS